MSLCELIESSGSEGIPLSGEGLLQKPEAMVEALADLWCRYVQKFSGGWLPGSFEMYTLMADLPCFEVLINAHWREEVIEDVYDHLARAFCQMVGLIACGMGSKEHLKESGVSQQALKEWREEVERLLDEWCWLPRGSPLFPQKFRWAMATSLGVDLPKKLPQILDEFNGLHQLRKFSDLINECLEAAQKAKSRGQQKDSYARIWDAPAKFALQTIHYLHGQQADEPPDPDAEGLIESLLKSLFAAVSPIYPMSVSLLAQLLDGARFTQQKIRVPYAKFFEEQLKESGPWQKWLEWNKGQTHRDQEFRDRFRFACLNHDLRGIVTGRSRGAKRVKFFKSRGLHANSRAFVPKLEVCEGV